MKSTDYAGCLKIGKPPMPIFPMVYYGLFMIISRLMLKKHQHRQSLDIPHDIETQGRGFHSADRLQSEQGDRFFFHGQEMFETFPSKLTDSWAQLLLFHGSQGISNLFPGLCPRFFKMGVDNSNCQSNFIEFVKPCLWILWMSRQVSIRTKVENGSMGRSGDVLVNALTLRV